MKNSKTFLRLFAVCVLGFALTLTGCAALRENTPNYKRAANRAARYGRNAVHNGYYRAVGINGTTGAPRNRAANYGRTALRRSGKIFGNVVDSRSGNTLRRTYARRPALNRPRATVNKYGYTPARINRRTFNGTYRRDSVNRYSHSHYYNRSGSNNVRNAVDRNYAGPAVNRRHLSYTKNYNNTGLYTDARPYAAVVDKGRLRRAGAYVKVAPEDDGVIRPVISDEMVNKKAVADKADKNSVPVKVSAKNGIHKAVTPSAAKIHKAAAPSAAKKSIQKAAPSAAKKITKAGASPKTVDAAKSTNVKRSSASSKVRVLTKAEIEARKLNKAPKEKPVENPTVNYWSRMASRIKNPITRDMNDPIYRGSTKGNIRNSGLSRSASVRRGAAQTGNVPFIRAASQGAADSYDRSYGPGGVYIYKH
jgi:hypothetical protein